MSASPPWGAEWLLIQLGAPDWLAGDLREALGKRSSGWYWGQVLAYAFARTGRALARHPLRAAWIACLTIFGLLAGSHLVAVSRLPSAAQALKIDVQSGGWVLGSSTDGHVHLVPAVNVQVTNDSLIELVDVQILAVFRHSTQDAKWGDQRRKVVGRPGLAPGGTTQLFAASPYGHVSSLPAAAMLDHTRFVDAHVQLFGRYGPQPWAKLGEFPISRNRLDAAMSGTQPNY